MKLTTSQQANEVYKELFLSKQSFGVLNSSASGGKKLLIVIPGSKTISIPLFQPFLNKLYLYLGVYVGNDDWPVKLKNFFDEYIDTVIFEWSGGSSEILSINTESKRLASFIKKYQDYDEIILFGKSLGGVVAEKAINKMEYDGKIKKLIYVATPHKSSNIKIIEHTKVINIYSDKDKYQKLANKVLYFGFGKQTLKNAKNICLKNLNHSDFNINKSIKIDGGIINLFDYYKKLIFE